MFGNDAHPEQCFDELEAKNDFTVSLGAPIEPNTECTNADITDFSVCHEQAPRSYPVPTVESILLQRVPLRTHTSEVFSDDEQMKPQQAEENAEAAPCEEPTNKAKAKQWRSPHPIRKARKSTQAASAKKAAKTTRPVAPAPVPTPVASENPAETELKYKCPHCANKVYESSRALGGHISKLH